MKKFSFILLFFIMITSFTSAETFTMAVIPDTQYYVETTYQKSLWYPYSNVQILYRQMQWIADNAVSNGGDLSFAVHLGDQVNNKGWLKSEWRRADKAASILDGSIPWLCVPGNHDYDRWSGFIWCKRRYVIGLKNYTRYFGSQSRHFKDAPWYGGAYRNGTSSWGILEHDGSRILILALEYQPTDDCLAWAQQIISDNKGTPVIVVTHENLVRSGSFARSSTMVKGGNLPEQVWEKLISQNNEIFLVLCGHMNGEVMRIDTNGAGYPVYALLSDYQGRSEIIPNRYNKKCGDGWLRLMEFDLESGIIHVKTYSTELDRYETDDDSQFDIVFDWDWNERFSEK